MMRLNPIIKKDLEIKSRSLTLPLIMTVVNAVLFSVGLAGSFGIVSEMKHSFSADYDRFFSIYIAVVMLEYTIVLFIAPLFTAASISGERETGTFDLMMTTKLTPADIIIEKLVSAVISMGTIIISGLPALCLPLMFGGVHIQNTIFLMVVIIAEALLILCIGMFASTIGKSSVKSIAIAYACTAVLVIGPVMIALLIGLFTGSGINNAAYILVMDPLLPIASLVLSQTGKSDIIMKLFSFMGAVPDISFIRNAALISYIIHMGMSFGLIILSIINIMPGHKLRQLHHVLEKE